MAAIVVLLVGMIVITAILAQRKKTAPVRRLHFTRPLLFPLYSPRRLDRQKISTADQRLEFVETFQSCASALAASDNAFFCAVADDCGATAGLCTIGLR